MLLLTGVARWGFLLLFLVVHLATWWLYMRPKKCWEETRNPVGNVRGWTEFPCCNAWNRGAVAAFVQVKREPLPSKTASAGGLWEWQIPAVSDKFHSTLLLDVTVACLASVASNVNASTAPWSYLLVSFAYCVATCGMRWSGYMVDYTGRSRWHPLLPSLIQGHR